MTTSNLPSGDRKIVPKKLTMEFDVPSTWEQVKNLGICVAGGGIVMWVAGMFFGSKEKKPPRSQKRS